MPDAQNIMQMSRLFRITIDDLLNEGESASDMPVVQSAAERTEAFHIRKDCLHLLAAVGFLIASCGWIIAMANCAHHVATAFFGLCFALCGCNAMAQFVLYFKKR